MEESGFELEEEVVKEEEKVLAFKLTIRVFMY